MAVREGLLSLLQPGPRYGYQLKTEFEAVTGGVWKLNVGQVYTTLDRLERDGFVVVDVSDDDQKSYSLTAAGREELGSWWAATPAEDPPPRDELMLKVMMAIESGRDHALDVITRQRTALFAVLQRHRRERPTEVIDPESLAARLVVDALVVRAEADLRWLDLCESRLNTPIPQNPASRNPASQNPASRNPASQNTERAHS
ncbi:MAG: PadR family transcriptional regulator [Ilumatobacteraceae bacterium]|nr:PadR family transcriptional regulator [Ilumatobacteraceae bacterium]